MRLGPGAGRRRRWPWGDSEWTPALANLGGEALRPAPVGAYEAGASAYGVEQLIGDVWEWTSSRRSSRGPASSRCSTPPTARRSSAATTGAARRLVGRRRRVGPAVLPQLGPPDPAADLQRAAAGLGRLRCAGTSPGWASRAPCRSLVLDPPFGLLRQSYAPRRQQRGLLNADGWGVGFFTPEQRRSRPAGARPKPLWGDASFASVAPVLRSGAVLAAVRSATVGMPMDESAAAPFTDGALAALPQRPGRPRRAAGRATTPSRCATPRVLAAHVFAEGVDQRRRDGAQGGRRRSRTPGSTCCSPTASGSSPSPGATR